MPNHENFDALFTARYQQHELPELLPIDRAQALVVGLDGVLARLDEVAASEIVPRADADLHARLGRTLRFYRAVEEFANADFLTELHSEADREVVRHLRDELRGVRATVATAAEAKAQEISAVAEVATAEILALVEAEQRLQALGDIIEETVALRYADENADDADDLADEVYVDEDDFEDEDYDQYDGEEEDGEADPLARSTHPFEAIFSINHEQTPLINRLRAERVEEVLGFVEASLAKLDEAQANPKLNMARDFDSWTAALEAYGEADAFNPAAAAERLRQYNKLVLTYEVLRDFPASENLKVLRTGEDLRSASLLTTVLVGFRNELLARKVALDEAQGDGDESGSAI